MTTRTLHSNRQLLKQSQISTTYVTFNMIGFGLTHYLYNAHFSN